MCHGAMTHGAMGHVIIFVFFAWLGIAIFLLLSAASGWSSGVDVCVHDSTRTAALPRALLLWDIILRRTVLQTPAKLHRVPSIGVCVCVCV